MVDAGTVFTEPMGETQVRLKIEKDSRSAAKRGNAARNPKRTIGSSLRGNTTVNFSENLFFFLLA